MNTRIELREKLLEEILRLVKKHPGIRPSELNKLLGREHSGSLREILIKRGLIVKKREGQAVRYYPKREVVFAFIDSQNLNLGTSKDLYKGKKIIYRGWKLDFKRFRKYLADKFRVSKAFLFIGYLEENKALYKYLESSGYEVVFKPTVKDSDGKSKGNVDAEMIVWTMRSVYERDCDKVVVVSGDGDFAVLADFLLEKDVLLKFIVPNDETISMLIKKVFIKRKKMDLLISLNGERSNLAIKKPLYRSGTGKHMASRTGGILH